ncbi:MAG: WhiB family transcriptional regulator, redox-sensing transcriptional regulator [Actinomycetota bacterium]|nr:WhiB family transcriptional regulator, redox-sensing transcriptional regulator [Actinomycetota bacterium]
MPWSRVSVEAERVYQQASHTLVLFLPTARTADNRMYATRFEAGMTQSSPVTEHDLARAWQEQAECAQYAGRVDFFPARGESVRDAKAVCTICPVRNECLEFAMRLKVVHGVWGGLSERERRSLRRERNRDAIGKRASH